MGDLISELLALRKAAIGSAPLPQRTAYPEIAALLGRIARRAAAEVRLQQCPFDPCSTAGLRLVPGGLSTAPALRIEALQSPKPAGFVGFPSLSSHPKFPQAGSGKSGD